MKRSLLLSLCLGIAAIWPQTSSAQSDRDKFEQFRQQINAKYDSFSKTNDRKFRGFRDSINNIYTQFLKNEWDRSSLNEGSPKPIKPEPKPVIDTKPAISSKPLPHTEPVSESNPTAQPEPIAPIVPEKPISEIFNFNFYGVKCTVHCPTAKFRLKDTSTESICGAWEAVTSGKYDQFLVDCLSYREQLKLCDWGLYQFLTIFSKNYFGDSDSNEAVILQTYALAQLGYKVRLCMQDNHLISLIAFSQKIFAVPYVVIDNNTFYNLSKVRRKGGIQVCNFTFPNEKSASLVMKSLPALPFLPTTQRRVGSKAYPTVSTEIRVNRNLIDFLDTYPSCSWELFATSSLSHEVKSQLYPLLKERIKSLSERNAANILLNFVQTGFEYKTDNEQFGREKTFFGDEHFYYPYCDCEDRSVLFAILVKELLGLDVVLLEYPSHIATAVCFNEKIEGDYFDLSGKKYIICDPTYIGAPIGKSMPDMLKLNANILRIR